MKTISVRSGGVLRIACLVSSCVACSGGPDEGPPDPGGETMPAQNVVSPEPEATSPPVATASPTSTADPGSPAQDPISVPMPPEQVPPPTVEPPSSNMPPPPVVEPPPTNEPPPQVEPPPEPTGFDYEGEAVRLDANWVIGEGESIRVGPGTSFAAAPGVTVTIRGALFVDGSDESPVTFTGGDAPRSWEGIVIEAGGYLELSHATIGGATYGIHARPGSDFSVDHADIGTSFKAAVIQASGSFAYTRFHASGDPTFSISNAAPITDVNGTLTIVDASPRIEHSSFDGSALLVDTVRIRGNSSPIFDHVSISDGHCGMHMEDGINTTPTVTNTVFQNLSYGVMAYTTQPKIEKSVFSEVSTGIGFCFGAQADNAPILNDNHFGGTLSVFDPSCTQIGSTNGNAAAAPNPEAGPQGL